MNNFYNTYDGFLKIAGDYKYSKESKCSQKNYLRGSNRRQLDILFFIFGFSKIFALQTDYSVKMWVCCKIHKGKENYYCKQASTEIKT